MRCGWSGARVPVLLLLCVARVCANNVCLDVSSVNIHPITRQGGVDGRTVLTGELFQLGDFDECVYRQQAVYCLSRVHLRPTSSDTPLAEYIQEHEQWWTHFKRDQLRWGVCAPRQCEDVDQLARSLETALLPVGEELGVAATVTLSPADCSTAGDQLATTTDYTFGGFMLLFLFLLLVGTVYDVLKTFIAPSTKEHNGACLLRCFSMPANITRLHSETSEESLAAIQGIRFLAMFGVIAGHCLFINLQGAVTNVVFIEQRYQEWLSMLFTNGHLIVSAFFVISGFLRAYHFMQEAAQEGHISVGMVLRSLLLRYLRLTPALAVVMALAATWLPSLGSGPLWHEQVGRVASNCRDHWWINLLYVNNYVYNDQSCLDHTWFLAVDWQLFVVSLVPLTLLWLWPGLSAALLAACLAACVLLSFFHTYLHQLRATVLTVPTVLQNLWADETFLRSYTSAQSNAVAYFIGITFGVVYHNMHGKNISKFWVIKWWLLLVPLLLSPILGGYCFYQRGYQYHHMLESIYAALYRVPFSYAVGSVIVLFALGYGWLANDILSCRPCIVLGRLTYCTYLVHFLWQTVEAGSRRTPLYLDSLQLMRASFLDLMISYICGFFLCICVEMPTSALMKHFMPKKSTEENKPRAKKPTPRS